MTTWKVKVKAWVPEQQITFEREVKADSKEAAEALAEVQIDDDEILEEICLDHVTYESEATPQ